MKVGKKSIQLAVLFILFVIVLELIMQFTVHNRKEKDLAEAFLKKNDAVSELVGGIKEVSYLKEGVDITSYNNRTEGSYPFKIIGNDKSIEVNVYWVTRDGKETVFSKIELSNPWQQAEVIWENKTDRSGSGDRASGSGDRASGSGSDQTNTQ